MLNDDLSQQIKRNFLYKPTEEQEIAITSFSDFFFSAEHDSVYLLKGYAGTGKTSLVSAIVKTLDSLKQKCVLLAPTGRAAKVFSHHAGHSAYTIHRRIYRQKAFTGDMTGFNLNFNKQRDTLFVPNDTHLNDTDDRVAIVTGPNMAGKSTYMRQTAIIVLMAQMGSFVPARSATVGICDRVFTRIGASDDLAGGASTFMVEMSEVASILKNATADSLLILDEIGRGTSTYDGMAIARAVLEYCADARKLGAKTMFATHYHELSALEGTIPGVRNYNISAKRQNGKLLFLRKILPGAADESYGIEVAKLAGVPESVIRAADAHLRELNAQGAAVKVTAPAKPESDQVSLADVGADAVAERLRAVDPNTLSPLEALRLLFELKNDLG